MVELAMLRERVQKAESHLHENQSSADILKQMIQTGSAKVGADNSIIVQPSQEEVGYRVSPNKLQADQKIEDA